MTKAKQVPSQHSLCQPVQRCPGSLEQDVTLLNSLAVQPVDAGEISVFADFADVQSAIDGEEIVHERIHAFAGGPHVNPLIDARRDSKTAAHLESRRASMSGLTC